MNGCDGSGGVKRQCGLLGNLYLRSTDMLFLEEELSIQVTHFDRVQINLSPPKQTIK